MEITSNLRIPFKNTLGLSAGVACEWPVVLNVVRVVNEYDLGLL